MVSVLRIANCVKYCFVLCTDLPGSTITEASASTREIYKATGIKNGKVCHHRTAALQLAGFMGLQPYQINTMTNHILDKQHVAYQAQAEWEVR